MELSYDMSQELAEAHDRNEDFSGSRANLGKVRLYREIKSDLTAFMERCEDAHLVDGFDPNVREKHAILWLDLSPAAVLDRTDLEALIKTMDKADGAVISAVDGHVRLTLEVKNIWEV